MSLRVIKPGILDTVQDLGRYNYQHLGINPGGAMDKLSAKLANILVGNNINEAVIELHFPAAELFFEKPALVAVTGADFTVTVNGEEIPCLHPVIVSKYSILQFHPKQSAARAYLAVYKGLDIPQWLSSYTTHLKAGAGGYKGRALQKDDAIPVSAVPAIDSLLGKKEFLVLPWKADPGKYDHPDDKLLILPGNEYEWLTHESMRQLSSQAYTISAQSDRMGYRMQGEPLVMQSQEEVVSSAVNFGTIQLQPDGQLIILMADHQTAGGYPRVGHVITASHSALAQMQPGEKVQFKMTDIEIAESLLIAQQRHLVQLENACRFKLEQILKD